MLRSVALLIALLCAAPLLLVLAFGLAPFSGEHAQSWQHVRETLLVSYALQTLILCVGVALFSGTLGTLTAWLATHYRFPGQRWLGWAMILPLAMPAYISAYSYGWLLDYAGPVQSALREATGWQHGQYMFPRIRSMGGAIWILGLATTPYVYMLARAAFLSQPREWWEAAATLGTYPVRFFTRIALPAARPFIATGVALALMEAIADIGTVGVLGVQTLSSGIYRSWFFMGEPLSAARLAAFLLIFVFVLMGLEWAGRRGMRYSSHRPITAQDGDRLSGLKGAGAFALCMLPVLCGFLLPLGALVRLSFYHSAIGVDSDVLHYAWQTIRLGAMAAVLTCAAALCMVCAERFHTHWLRFITLFANLGYAIPGAVLAVGLMLLFGWLREAASLSWTLTGGMAGLLMAYSVRFMATAYSPLHGGMLRIPPELDMAAASLGKRQWTVIRRVHVPLLLFPMCVAGLLVFLDVIKELPATLILRPFDVKPLAIAAYEFASDDRYVEASPYALLLVAIATMAVIALHIIQHTNPRKWHV